MRPAAYITAFQVAQTPVTELITKFGGQPVWLEDPVWPLHPEKDELLPFLGQVALEPGLFGEMTAQMAYLFFGVYDEHERGGPNWDACAVVVQPGRFEASSRAERTGPSIQTLCKYADGRETRVVLEPRIDEDYPSSEQFKGWNEARVGQFFQKLYGSKLGGTPALHADWMAPEEGLEDWHLLLQIDANDDFKFPYPTGLDDTGLVWFYLAKDGLRTTFGLGESDY